MHRLVFAAACAPVPATVIGAIVAHEHGVAWQAFAPNALGVVVGIAMMTAMLSSTIANVARRWMPFVSCVLISATLVFDGLDGVHRWLQMPGLRLHASMALAPWLLLPLARVQEARAFAVGLVVVVVAQAVHIAQPDAGQATALAASSVALLLFRARIARNIIASFLAIAMCVAAWLRPDDLAPVDHVERILRMIADDVVSTAFALGAALCLFAPFVFVALRVVAVRALALACVVMLASLFAVTFAGNFPVPVFGAGASGVIGWYSMLAALLALRQERAQLHL